jgi:hypothetical protein
MPAPAAASTTPQGRIVGHGLSIDCQLQNLKAPAVDTVGVPLALGSIKTRRLACELYGLSVDLGLVHTQPEAADIGECAGKRRRHGAHQIMHGSGAEPPIDASVLGPTPAKIGPLRQIQGSGRCCARDQRRQAAPQHLLGRGCDFHRDLQCIVIFQDRYRLLVDQGARVGLFQHVVQTGARLGLTLDDGPMHRRPAAVFRQQRAMHIECAAAWQLQPLNIEHVAIIEGKHKVGLFSSAQVKPLRRVG